MTAIAWAIFIYAVTLDRTLDTASEGAKNLAYGMCSLGLAFMIAITIKELLK